MNDAGLSQPGGNEAVQGRECGNGVVIDHNGGWQTQYCHLRNGSVSVKPREFVAAGTRLGFVGMSGFAEFPHVHLAVRRDGMEVDPFTGLQVGDGCSAAALPLWNADVKLAYEPAALYNAGFSAGPPDVGRIRAGEQPAALDRQSPALVLWVDIFGVVQGDRILFTISGPEGNSIIEQDQTIEKTQARRYMYVGKRRTVRVWPAGTYIGKITLTRATSDGTPWQASVDRQITIP
jgi:murein DD-endopeptidase MepM/ murein hydrolase activator NlpD